MKMPPEHTLRYDSFRLTDLLVDEIVISIETSPEERGRIDAWNELKRDDFDRLILLRDTSPDTVTVLCSDGSQPVLLTDCDRLVSLSKGDKVLIDITALPHHVWAPIFQAYVKAGKQVRALYVEPDSYKTHPSPASANLFDLSVSFGGLSPLPGFAKLTGPSDGEPTLFVAFLGFEGNRAERIINQIEPQPRVIPIIGVPGFQINYPAITVACNRSFLNEFQCNADIRLAKASCPFEAFDALASIRRDFPDHYLYIAPVGTRPHALGALQYAIANESHCEILFDHPVRQSNRTNGRGLIHVFRFSP
ncbi:MAG: hypothetical protein U1D25_18355 [Hydrogenophaga sp.]|uniref:hypothetical protein n=1 Tax=Hydrogenophaga sp. TaxID=1904254 RepID=UPI00274AB185|nr:hypothetical protein [Hydrogenophaga sp.]MDP2419485.1 hypothetical protein [Hydrogenophaga sp.]MDZ4190048.1 hypothetical protein [Hydrogenophaga sp.]